jgi:hypothetical protein
MLANDDGHAQQHAMHMHMHKDHVLVFGPMALML